MVDKDLLSVQEARALVRGGRKALSALAGLDQAKIDSLIQNLANAGAAHAEELARMAVEETGFGKWEDKKAKNILATRKLSEHIASMKTVGIIGEDKNKQILKIAAPAGVIAALIPSTNPTSTTLYKAIIAIKAGNAVVFSPHPSAVNCIRRTVEVLQDVLTQYGLPADLLSMMAIPTLEGTAELMKCADLILATGGPAMVKAAYSSGTPALGVGSGNVPAFIERSADISKALDRILMSKTFDNGTVCASEQSIVTENHIAAEVETQLKAKGGYFLNDEEVARVKPIMERPNGAMNPTIVGRNAKYIADLAGLTIPPDTRVLVYKERGVGPGFPFSKEKLTALLGFYTVEDWEQACELCHKLLKNGGIGHSLAIHSGNDQVIREFAMKKPVSRLLVNTPSTQGAVGLSTGLPPSLTLGCGTVGGSATSDNIGPEHLFNTRYLAYDNGSLGVSTGSVSGNTALESEVSRITRMVIEQLEGTGI